MLFAKNGTQFGQIWPPESHLLFNRSFWVRWRDAWSGGSISTPNCPFRAIDGKKRIDDCDGTGKFLSISPWKHLDWWESGPLRPFFAENQFSPANEAVFMGLVVQRWYFDVTACALKTWQTYMHPGYPFPMYGKSLASFWAPGKISIVLPIGIFRINSKISFYLLMNLYSLGKL